MGTFQIFMGTVGLALLVCAVGAWALMKARKALEDDDAGEADLLVEERAPRLVADNSERRDEGELHALWAEQRRRELRQRLEAATKTPRGPARLEGRRVPPDAA